ncbi:MAG: 4-(cytidine 5'-diphospho)-2-C-methyl-D-erythritol kinase [Pyrinomonadaceae bacterium]
MAFEFAIPSFAKINLDLRVHGKRGDGFHEISTLFQTISLCDSVIFRDSEKIQVTCDREDIPSNLDNIAGKAIAELAKRYEIDRGISVSIKKRIPAPGGLGGGSSNAAVALIGASRAWGLKPKLSEMVEIAELLGADVPFFLTGGLAAGFGKGNEVIALDDTPPCHVLVATAPVSVNTGEAYSSLESSDLTTIDRESILEHYRKDAEHILCGELERFNSFENGVFAKYPEIEKTAGVLEKLGARRVTLSGSGSSVFATFSDDKLFAVASADPELNRISAVFPATTLKRSSYFGLTHLEDAFSPDI